MNTLVVTGHVSGKKYAIPVSQISLISEEDYGTRIDVKDAFGGTNNKFKHVECLESLQDVVQTLAAMN